VLDIGRKIDGAAEEFCRDLIAEEKRLTGLLTSYQIEQQRIAREAEQKRQAELARQQEEERKRQAEIDRKAREAEQARLAAERAERDAKTAEARAKAQQEAKEAADKAAALAAQKEKEQAAAKLEQAELMRAPAPTAPKAAGTSVSQPWVFEVTDAKALHAARPELVDLVVRRNDIITRIRQGEREIPGLRIYQDTRVTVRT
jgi:membrane protein involved in colicin uptake